MPQRLTPDICVIGAGSAGLTVAVAAAAFGVKVVLVERGEMGGECLNTGCVPSKALLAAATHASAIRKARQFGVDAVAPDIDFSQVRAHVRSVIAAIAPNDSAERFTAMGVHVVRQSARFIDPRTLAAGDFEIHARRFVIATGSSPAIPPIPGLAEVEFFTNETIFALEKRPEHLVVLGGGAVGLEMAAAHRRLGARVTILEAATPLASEDPELTAILLDRLRGEGIVIHAQTKVSSAEAADGGATRLICSGPDGDFEVEGDVLLVAAGRKPVLADLGLDAAGVRHNEDGIIVGANLRSSNRRVYAIGDVVSGGLRFTHVAGYQAGLVVQQMLFRLPAREKRHLIPRAIYTAPDLASVGLGETEARRRHSGIHVLRWPFSENDRAQAERSTDGLIKIVADRKGRILGASILGADAGEMINLWSLAVAKRLTVADIRAYVAPYPTMAEIGKRAALTYYAPLTRKPLVRRIVRLLARFG